MWLIVQGAAVIVASLAGIINGFDQAPYILGVGCCSIALGLWFRQSR